MSEKGQKITYKFNKNAYNFKTTQANAVFFFFVTTSVLPQLYIALSTLKSYEPLVLKL